MEIVAIIALVVALGAVVWAVRQPAKTQRPEESVIQDQIDTTVIFEGIASLHKAQKESLDGHITTLLDPTKNEFKNMQRAIGELQTAYKTHSGVTEQLDKQVNALTDSTTNLYSSMKSSTDRGTWGEMQLRNVIEFAGLDRVADFKEQVKIDGGGKPDVLINLPDGGAIAVDAKVPGAAYLQLAETEEESKRKELLDKHVKAIQDMVKDLNKKNYPGKLEKSIRFVVMFIPVESMLSDALRHKPELLRESLEKNVLLTTPMNLLALLVAVEKGWKSDAFEKNLDQIKENISVVYAKFLPLIDHINELGDELSQATKKYNDIIASIDGNLMTKLDQVREFGLQTKTGKNHNQLRGSIEPTKKIEEHKLLEWESDLNPSEDLEEPND